MTTAAGKPRLVDVALLADVSIATVSLALSDHPHVNRDTRRRVLEASRKLGYRRKTRFQPVVGEEPQRFGFIVLGTEIQNVTNAPILFHLSRAGLSRDIRFEYATTTREMSPDEVWETVSRFCRGLDGLILMGLVDKPLLERLRRAEVAHVVLGHVVGDQEDCMSAATTVANDDQRMGMFTTQRLLRAGHRRIGFVCEFLPPGLAHHRWLAGYKLALLEAGLELDPGLVQVTGQPESGAGPAVKQLLRLKNRPTAFSVPDARIAVSLVGELRQRGVELPRSAIMFTADENMAVSMGLADYPRVTGRADLMVDLAITHLQWLRRNPGMPPVQLLVPFDAFNLPEPGGPVSALQP